MNWVPVKYAGNMHQVVLSPRPVDQLRTGDVIRVQTTAAPTDGVTQALRLEAGETYQLHLPPHREDVSPALIDPNTGRVAEDVADDDGALVLVGLVPHRCVGVRYAKFVGCSPSRERERNSAEMAVEVRVIA